MIVAKATYEVTDATVDSQILTLKASGADTMINVCTPKFSAQAIRARLRLRLAAAAHREQRGCLGGQRAHARGPGKSEGISRCSTTRMNPTRSGRTTPRCWNGAASWEVLPRWQCDDASNVYAYITAQPMAQVLKQCNGNFSRDNIASRPRA